MFEKNRKALVKDYTVMLTVVLSGTLFLAYIFLAVTVYTQQKELMAVFVHEESEEWHSALKLQASDGDLPDGDEDNADRSAYVDKLFYYVYDADGRALGQLKAPERLELHVKDTIAAGELIDSEVDLRIFFQEPYFHKLSAYMIVKNELFYQGKKVGEIYAGKDVLSYVKLLWKALVVFVLLIILMMLISVYMARRMAGKAMIPIQDSFQRQKDFAANASHELRTPLSVISAGIETIERNKGTVLSDFSRGVLADLKEELLYMKKLTEELLALARLDGPQNLPAGNPAELAVDELLSQVQSVFLPVAETKAIKIEISPAGERVFADRSQLLQILRLLVDNALKYTAAGGHVFLSSRKLPGERVEICVRDDGCGIEPADLAKVFERFYRSDKARSRSVGGTGLGLSLARELTAANNGRIHVESKAGAGSAFFVELPVKKTV